MQKLLRSYTQPARPGVTSEMEDTVRRYAPMVYRVVRKVAERIPPSVDREYLFSAGMMGLVDAITKYDAARGIAFEAYARIRVKGAILDEVRGLDHLTRGMRQRSRSIQQVREALALKAGGPVSDAEVAEHAGLSIEDVQGSQNRKAPPESFDARATDAIEHEMLWRETASPLERLEWQERVRLLADALALLPERNRLVVSLYYERELTLQEIGDVLGVTQSRVSQILRKTMGLLRETMEKAE